MASLHEPQSAVPLLASDRATGAGSQAPDPTGWKPRSALVGTLLANRYRISGLLGQGSTGAVFHADDIQQGKPVAVRVLVPALVQQPGLIPRIRARIERNSALERGEPGTLINLVDIFDVGMTLEGELFVVTDFIDGDHLSTMLSRGGRLPWSRARSLLVRLCQIVHGLHEQGIVLGALEARHCYAVRGKNKHEAIKVMSTAISEHVASTIGPHASHAATILARYVAPEQACGEAIDARSDIYSFGIIAYELLTGSVPFMDTNPVRLVSMHLQLLPRPPRAAAPEAGIPAEVESALLRCLAKSPADRFPSMDVLADVLLAIPESVPTGVHANVAASDAASEIPISPVDPGAAAATLAITNKTSPPAEDPGATAPGTAAATLAITNKTSPPAEHSTEPVDAPPPLASDVRPETVAEPTKTEPEKPEPTKLEPAADAPRPMVRTLSAGVPRTQVTYPPGSLSVSDITRPATLAPGGPLRLPPRPNLNRPATIPPTGMFTPPSLGVPRSPGPHTPSAALPAGTVRDPNQPAPADAATAATATTADSQRQPVPADSSAQPAPSDSQTATQPAPSDSLAASATQPVPSDSPSQSVLTDSSAPTGATAPADNPQPTPADSLSAADTLARATTVVAPATAATAPTATPTRTRDEETRASASGSRRIVVQLTDIRSRPEDGASTSGTYMRTALADAAESARPDPQARAERSQSAAAQAAAPQPVVSEQALRGAALASTAASPVPASLSQISSTTDSLVAAVPRSRTGWIVGIVGLAAAAGIAALVLTSPSFTGETQPTQASKPLATQPKLAQTTVKPVTPLPDVDRGAAAMPPEPPEVQDPPDPTGQAALVAPTTAVADREPSSEPDPEPTPGKKKKETGKKKRREPLEPEEPEKDVFDQLREHMEKKKAQEAEYAANLARSNNPTPTPTPTPTPVPKEGQTDAEKAKETLERARQAASTGNPQLGYSLAKQSYSLARSQEALEIMGTCACRLKNETNARAAHVALSGSPRRASVVDACSKTGITL